MKGSIDPNGPFGMDQESSIENMLVYPLRDPYLLEKEYGLSFAYGSSYGSITPYVLDIIWNNSNNWWYKEIREYENNLQQYITIFRVPINYNDFAISDKNLIHMNLDLNKILLPKSFLYQFFYIRSLSNKLSIVQYST